MITRDFEPVKPDPAAVHHICAGWGCSPEDVMVVGDDKTDIECGNRAGAGMSVCFQSHIYMMY